MMQCESDLSESCRTLLAFLDRPLGLSKFPAQNLLGGKKRRNAKHAVPGVLNNDNTNFLTSVYHWMSSGRK